MYDSKYMVLWKRQIDGDIKIFSIFQGIGSRKGAFQEAQWEWHQRRGFHLWVRKMPWSRKWQPTSVFIPGKFYGQKSLVGYSPWAYKELGTTEWLNTHTHTHTHTHTEAHTQTHTQRKKPYYSFLTWNSDSYFEWSPPAIPSPSLVPSVSLLLPTFPEDSQFLPSSTLSSGDTGTVLSVPSPWQLHCWRSRCLQEPGNQVHFFTWFSSSTNHDLV